MKWCWRPFFQTHKNISYHKKIILAILENDSLFIHPRCNPYKKWANKYPALHSSTLENRFTRFLIWSFKVSPKHVKKATPECCNLRPTGGIFHPFHLVHFINLNTMMLTSLGNRPLSNISNMWMVTSVCHRILCSTSERLVVTISIRFDIQEKKAKWKAILWPLVWF